MGDTAPGRDFDPAFRKQFEQLLRWRRDVRRFRSDPVDPHLLAKLLGLVNLSPSVGLSEPWRYVNVVRAETRAAVIRSFEACNQAALQTYEGKEARTYEQLKLEGLREAPVHLAVFSDSQTRKGKRLGRMTMPQMLDYSSVLSIYTFWLAARTHGLGVGWVSILDPDEMTKVLDVPDTWTFLAYLCVGWPEEGHLDPELERKGWETRTASSVTLLER